MTNIADLEFSKTAGGYASSSFHQAQLQGILCHSESLLMIEKSLALPPAVLPFLNQAQLLGVLGNFGSVLIVKNRLALPPAVSSSNSRHAWPLPIFRASKLSAYSFSNFVCVPRQGKLSYIIITTHQR